MSQDERDETLGAALRALDVPDYEAGFDVRLRRQLEADTPSRRRSRRRRGRRRPEALGSRLLPSWGPLTVGLAVTTIALAVLLGRDSGRVGPLGVQPATAAELGQRVANALASARTLAGVLVVRERPSSDAPFATSRTRFLLRAEGDQRLTTDGGGDSAYRVATATETTLNDPLANGRPVVRRGLAPGRPDGGPTDLGLRRQLAAVAQALLRAGDQRIRSTRYQGRRAYRLSVPAATNLNAEPGVTADRMQVVVDRATGLPLQVRESYRGRLIMERRIQSLRVNVPAPAAAFSLQTPSDADVLRFDEGYRRVTPAQAVKRAGYSPPLPRWLPAGFVRAQTYTARRSGRTGNEGANPVSRGVVSTVYRRGFQAVLVTSRLRGARVGVCAPTGIGSGPCWADPLGAGEGFVVREQPVRLDRGALSGARSRLIIDPRAIPHLWALTGRYLVTVSGDLGADEIVRVATSLVASR